MYAIWVWKGKAVIIEDAPFLWITYRVHKAAWCYDKVKTMKDAQRECKMHSWKVVYSHLEEQE